MKTRLLSLTFLLLAAITVLAVGTTAATAATLRTDPIWHGRVIAPDLAIKLNRGRQPNPSWHLRLVESSVIAAAVPATAGELTTRGG